MATNDVYALNTLNGVVQKIRPALLSHPTLGKHLVEVDSPDVCIACGEQPDEVTTVDGEVIDLTSDYTYNPEEESE